MLLLARSLLVNRPSNSPLVRVRPGLRNRIDHGPREPAVLGGCAKPGDLHLFDDVVVVEHPGRPGLRVAGVDAVDKQRAAVVLVAAVRRAVVDAGRVVQQLCRGVELADIQRHRPQQVLRDRGFGRRAREVDRRRAGDDVDALGQAADLQGQVHRQRFAEADVQIPLDSRRETREVGLHFVHARRQALEAVLALLVGDLGLRTLAARQRHCHAREDGTLLVHNPADDRPCLCLR